MDKDKEIMQIQYKLRWQDSQVYHSQQQIKEHQQQNDDIKNAQKLEIAKSNKSLTNNTEEIFRLKNHSMTLVTKIKKLKNSQKAEHST